MGRGITKPKQTEPQSQPGPEPQPQHKNNLKAYSPDQLLRAREVAMVLGLSKTSAYRLIYTKELPAVRFGKSVRVKYQDLEEFIENNRQ